MRTGCRRIGGSLICFYQMTYTAGAASAVSRNEDMVMEMYEQNTVRLVLCDPNQDYMNEEWYMSSFFMNEKGRRLMARRVVEDAMKAVT